MIALAGALLISYIVTWVQVSRLQIGRSDFTSTYVGATLVRDGQRLQLYDESIQTPLHTRLIAPDTEGDLPFVDAPIAAALAVPVTLVDLGTAYRIWSWLQAALLVVAVVVAVRAASWSPRTPRTLKVATAMAALAGAGSLVALMQAQWGGVSALGLALAYQEWKRGHQAAGAAVLVVAAAIAKPHLAVGLLAFMAGWRERRVIVGALMGGLGMVAVSTAIVGPAGMVHFVSFALSSNTRWDLRSFSSFVGIPGSFLGNSTTAQIIGAIGSVIALIGAWRLGSLVRRRPERLDAALAGATVLSLLAAPHVGSHDLVMLAPAMVWSVPLALHANVSAHLHARVNALAMLATTWTLISVALVVSLADGASLPPGQLTPWVLIAAVVIAWQQARVGVQRPPRVRSEWRGGHIFRPTQDLGDHG